MPAGKTPNGFGALFAVQEEGTAASKVCSACGETKVEALFSQKQWKAKAHSRKCSACVESGTVAPDSGTKSSASGQQEALSGSRPDILTLEEIAIHLATARAKYHQHPNLPDEAVCRMMLTTRMQNLPLSRCKEAPSSMPGAGQGLFVTRDIEAGELITLYPADALLIWEDADHSIDSNVKIFFSKHIPTKERDVARAVTELRGYEVPCHQHMSIVADPRHKEDAAYLAHLANDGALLSSPEGREEYERASALKANAEVIPLEVEETDSQGNNLILHYAMRATHAIPAQHEVFVTYGFGYWELYNAGLFNLPQAAN